MSQLLEQRAITREERMDAWDFSLWDIQWRRSKTSFFYFVEQVLQLKEYINEYRDPLGEPPLLDYGWHIKHWCKLPHKYHKIHTRAPRDHWKSMIWCISFLLWRALFKDPMYAISLTHDLAKEKLWRLRDLVECRADFFMPPDAELRKLVPGKINPKGKIGWGEERLVFSNGARIDIAGFRTASRGPHPRTIVVDDPHGETQNFSMDFAWDLFRGTIRSMVPRGGYLVLVGTSFAQDDLHHRLEENPLFKEPDGYAELLPAIIDWETKEVLWEAWMDWLALMQRRAEIGFLLFDREFLLRVISEEISLFPMALFRQCFAPMDILLYEYTGELPTFSGWDLAISTSPEADYTVGVTLALDEFGNRVIMDIFRERGIGYSDQWAAIESVYRRFLPKIINIESNAYQRALPDEMAKFTDLPIAEFKTGSQKNTFEVGLPSLRKLFENQKFKIPRGNEISKTYTDHLMHELHSLTMQEGKVITAARFDDIAMALWFADQAILTWREVQGWHGAMELPEYAPKDFAERKSTYGDKIPEYRERSPY